MGDMPALVRDRQGKFVKILIRDVRLVPTFRDTLFSCDQFFEQQEKVYSYLNDDRYFIFAKGTPQEQLIPFERRDNLYQWAIMPLASAPAGVADYADVKAMKATVHGPRSTSHLEALSPDRLLETLHRRLHIGHDILRRLGSVAADVPSNISDGLAHTCEHCKEANATHVPGRTRARATRPRAPVHASTPT